MTPTQAPATGTPAAPAPAPRARRRAWPIVLAVLAAALVVLVLIWDWNWFKKPIERRVSAATGREFHIDGDLSVKLGLKPRITFDKLRLGNLPGAKEQPMASADRLQFRLHLSPLVFKRDVVLSQVRVAKPDLLLERLPGGRANWVFPAGEAEWPTIRDLQVGDGRVRFRDPDKKTDMAFTIRSGERGADARLAPLLLDGKGKYRGNVVAVDGRIDSPLALKDPTRPYRIDLRGHAGPTSATAKGTLAGLQMHGFNLDFGLRGPNLALLYPLLGIAIPDTPPYTLQGRLTREARTWHYDDFHGHVGDSDLSGDAAVTTGGERPFLKADLVSKRLDFDDLAGFVGAPPQTRGGEAATPEQRRQAAALAASSRVLPDRPFRLEKLRRMDADVRLRANRVNAPSLPIDDMDAHLFLEDAVLRLDPLNFGVAGGDIRSTIRMDARKDTIATNAKIRARGLQLPRLFPRAELTRGSAGAIGGDVALAGSGNSVAKMLASSDGDVGLHMGSGRISNLLMEFAGIDIAESVKFMLTKDKVIPIRCAFGDFAVDDGLMRAERLAFDTTDTLIYGAGTISLDEERLDLTLKAKPKDHSFLSLRAPLRVDGTFKDPGFHPDVGKITLRAVAAAVLGGITPPAALLATYETGPGKGKRVACRGGARDDPPETRAAVAEAEARSKG